MAIAEKSIDPAEASDLPMCASESSEAHLRDRKEHHS